MRKESVFQSNLIEELHFLFPGCVILKNDPTYIQGMPDLIILWGDRWAVLECKRSVHESHQPNQDYYVDKMNGMSFARFVYPENKEEVLNDLQQAFGTGRSARFSECQ